MHYNSEQTCCGQPAFNSGYWDEARTLAGKFLTDFKPDMPVVSPSGSCTGYIRRHYRKLFEGQPEKLAQLDALYPQIFELSDFLVNVLKVNDFEAVFPHKHTFHDSWSALREYGIKDEPRQLLRNVKGLELIEMCESDTCCGFGGTFAVKNAGISTAMDEKKVRNEVETGADLSLAPKPRA